VRDGVRLGSDGVAVRVVMMPFVVMPMTFLAAVRIAFAVSFAAGAFVAMAAFATGHAAHSRLVAPATIVTPATSEVAYEPAEREADQAEEEDLGPVGVHGGSLCGAKL
jgi:hypothetical protein